MAKVVLISPPYVDLYGKLSRAAGRYFPLGIAYIAAYLRFYGKHEVYMYEMEAQNLNYEDVAAIFKEIAPDVIGLTCSTPNFLRAIKLAQIARENTKAKIILGGVHASALPDFIMQEYSDYIDYIVKGEGEITMLELVDSLENNTSVSTINGLVFLHEGKIVSTPDRLFIDDLDILPFPARDLIPAELFIPNLHNARYRRCFTIITSRGCPFNCSFCASRVVSGIRYRTHSAGYVLSEMEMLKKNYNAQQLVITDDTFTIDRERVEAICKGMIKKQLNLKWFCFSQINTIDKPLLKLMKKAGCYSIGFGIESAEEEILRKLGKPIKPGKALEAVKLANEAGLKTQAFYIFGAPGETKKQMLNTINFAKRVNATLAFFNMLVPYPGTRDFNHFFSSVPLDKIDWHNFVAVGENCVLQESSISASEIEKLLAKAYIRYFTSPVIIFNLLRQIRTYYEFSNYIMAGASLFNQVSKWSVKKNHYN